MPRTEMPPGAGRMVQIDTDNVSPTRYRGRNPRTGLPIEETVFTLAKTEKWVDRDGNICEVALRTSRQLGNTTEDEKYEDLQRRDQIALGALPLAECPYTTEYARIVNPARADDVPDSLIEMPPGAVPCKGKPDGCEHLRPVIAERRERKMADHRAAESLQASVPAHIVNGMMREFGEGFGAHVHAAAPAMPTPASAKAARANMAAGRGEPDK